MVFLKKNNNTVYGRQFKQTLQGGKCDDMYMILAFYSYLFVRVFFICFFEISFFDNAAVIVFIYHVSDVTNININFLLKIDIDVNVTPK